MAIHGQISGYSNKNQNQGGDWQSRKESVEVIDATKIVMNKRVPASS
jgi:hypothetical protein